MVEQLAEDYFKLIKKDLKIWEGNSYISLNNIILYKQEKTYCSKDE